jgi:hypothetical protein
MTSGQMSNVDAPLVRQDKPVAYPVYQTGRDHAAPAAQVGDDGGVLHPLRLPLADLVVETTTHRVTPAGRSIAFSGKEYDLLVCLLQHAEQVRTRSVIREHVWDEEDVPHSNEIDVYVRRLRPKIDAGYRPPLLHTARGSGYLLGILPEAGTVSCVPGTIRRQRRGAGRPPGHPQAQTHHRTPALHTTPCLDTCCWPFDGRMRGCQRTPPPECRQGVRTPDGVSAVSLGVPPVSATSRRTRQSGPEVRFRWRW